MQQSQRYKNKIQRVKMQRSVGEPVFKLSERNSCRVCEKIVLQPDATRSSQRPG